MFKWRRLGLLFWVSLFCIGILPIYSQRFPVAPVTNLTVSDVTDSFLKIEGYAGLSSELEQLVQIYQQNGDYSGFARQIGLTLERDQIIVTVFPIAKSVQAIDQTALLNAGATVLAKSKLSLRIKISVGNLQALAAVPGIRHISRQVKPQPDAIISEGVDLMNADAWQNAGYYGAGAKVAIIDGGFYKLTEAQNNGDIPATYYSVDYTGRGLQSSADGEHGTAVTEAVYDVAPQAQFYLYKIDDVTDLELAKEDCIGQGVHIVNHSMSWFLLSYYDGTGPACEVASDAVANNITWVNSAGNRADSHYRAVFTPIADNFHDMTGAGQKLNPLGPKPGSVWLFPQFTIIQGWLNWDDYPATAQDYDLYLYKWNYSTSAWDEIASSKKRQSGIEEPTESIAYLNREKDGRYAFAVKKHSATQNVDFTLFTGYGISYHIPESSLTDPGSVTDVVTVAAISMNHYDSGPQEYFSGQGPTTDGRPKPDVASPDSCNSFAYGYWQGTSLSSPYAAGVCALIKSRFPSFNESDIRNYLYSNCTVDLGDQGRDHIYGWGKVVLPELTASIAVVFPNGGENLAIDSAQNITWSSSGTSGTVRIDFSTNNGSDWTPIIASTEDDGLYSWTVPDQPSAYCLIRITDTDGSPTDQSDAVFAIYRTSYNISGTVAYDETGRWTPNAVIDLVHNQGSTSTMSNSSGAYQFENIPSGAVTLTPSKNGDQSDAISGSDALLVLQYLAFLISMNDEQQFAADVTEDGSVTGSDAQAIMRYLAFYNTNIGATGQWRFLPSSTTFTLADHTTANFKGYLKGDANLDWQSGSGLGKSTFSAMSLNLTPVESSAGNEVVYALALDTMGEPMQTLLLSLTFNFELLTFLNAYRSDLLADFNMVQNTEQPGRIHIAMASITGLNGSGEILRLLFRMNSGTGLSSQADSKDLNIVRALANDLVISNTELTPQQSISPNTETFPSRYYLEQNYPNPFNPSTRISYQLPEANHVMIKIYNLVGDEIATLVDEQKPAGFHQLIWNGKDGFGREVSSGLYLVEIRSGPFQMKRKMLKVQ